VQIETTPTTYRVTDYERRRALRRAELRERRLRFAAAVGLFVGFVLTVVAWSVAGVP
jgi:hypothetical protein